MAEKIIFEPKDPKLTIVRVSEADYARDFSAEKQPWEATVEEWETYLFRTGLFRETKRPGNTDRPKTADRGPAVKE